MKITIFYSWQSDYKECCDDVIQKALDLAKDELNSKQSEFEYCVKRGGGDSVNSQEITENIDKALKNNANLVVSDFTNIGKNNNFNWIRRIIRRLFHNTMKFKAHVNSNVAYETGKGEAYLGNKGQIIKVYNQHYGDCEKGMEFPFDFRPENRPIGFCCAENTTDKEKQSIINELSIKLVNAINEGTKKYLGNQKRRFAPLQPITEELQKVIYNQPFFSSEQHKIIFQSILEGRSFRLLGLPGTGKTRAICEAFRTKNANVCYCDCKSLKFNDIKSPIIDLLKVNEHRQTIILDNCQNELCNDIKRIIDEYDFDCQLITIYHDIRDSRNCVLDIIKLELQANKDVVQRIVEGIDGLTGNAKKTIIELSDGFPLMALKICDKYKKENNVSALTKSDIYDRILNLDPKCSEDVETQKILTAFAIFKYIGIEGEEARMSDFIANNAIVTGLNHGNAEEKSIVFHQVFKSYSKNDILEQSGHMGFMRLIPLAIYLSEQWYRQQDSETIRMLIRQIMDISDEWVKNKLVDSLSKRITLLSDIPLAKKLVDNLLSNSSPFLSEEVVLSKTGSRLFLGLSEVNPEICASKLYTILSSKSDDDIKKIEDAKYNLSTALDRLAFDKRSFQNAMLTLARFSTIGTNWLSDNTNGLFVDRFPIMLPATEASLTERLMVLKELIPEKRYHNLVKRALFMAININHNYRMGGAEKQGLKQLEDYVPKICEVLNYFYECFDMLLGLAESDADIDEICLSIAEYARGYYAYGLDNFLFKALEVLAPKKDFAWDNMKVALSDLLRYDAAKHNNHNADLIREWLNKLTNDDYVSRLKNINHQISQLDLSFDETMKVVNEKCKSFAKEFIDNQLYKDKKTIPAIMRSKSLYMNRYGEYLSIYAQEKGLQQVLLDNILSIFLGQETSNDGKTFFLHYIYKVDNKEIVEQVYETIIKTNKKTILPALYAIKDEPEERLSQLFDMLDKKEIELNNFNGYFLYVQQHQKYVLKRLLNYGDEAITMILIRYDSFLYNTEPEDNEYKIIARELLLKMRLQGVLMEDYTYCDCVRKYLAKKCDRDIVLHIHNLTKEMLHSPRSNHYLLELYWIVFHSNKNLLKPLLLLLLEDKEECNRWFETLRTCYTNENPSYLELSYQEWFEWLNKGEKIEDKAYVLAEIFSYADGNDKANTYLVKLLNDYFSNSILSCICSRIESFSWIGSGIPTYRSRIAICKDYILQLEKEEAKQRFNKIIKSFEENINAEIVNNANERVIYRYL